MMGGPGSGRAAPCGVRYVLVHWRNAGGSRRRHSHQTEERAIEDGEALIRARLADHYQVDRVETVARRSR